MQKQFLVLAALMLASLPLATEARADDAAKDGKGILLQNAARAKYVSAPGVPACVTLAPLRGDMSKGGSTLLVRMTPGCTVPFHWHTPTEELVVLQGKPFGQMLHERPYELKVGSYSQLPAQHVHRFRCMSKDACLLFLVADAAFDIHFVDDQGKEISTDAALDAAKKSANTKW